MRSDMSRPSEHFVLRSLIVLQLLDLLHIRGYLQLKHAEIRVL